MVALQIPILSNYLEKRSTTRRLMSNLDDPDHTFFNLMMPYVNSGVAVNENTAVNASVVWRAVTLLAGTIASLPLPVYKRLQPRGKERAGNHPLYYKLHNRPNSEISSFEWRIMGISNQLLWGNWYNEIERVNNIPVGLWPISPWRVKPVRSTGGELFYNIKLPDGGEKTIPRYNMFHVKNLYIDGDVGKSCLAAGREAIGLGLAAEEFGARFFGSGASVGGIVEYPGKLKDDARERFIKAVQEKYSGLGKAHRLMLLEEGLKYHQVGIPPDQAQFLQTRKFQVAEIGRFFFITQLHKLGDLDKSSFNNIEHQGIEFVVDTIRPLLVNIEQEINHKLFYDAGSPDYFAEFVIDGLLRGDSAARAEFYNKLFQIGGLSVNDILELENRNPIGDEGNERFVPMNMIPLKRALEEPEPFTAPEPDEPDENSRTEYRSGLSRTKISQNYRRIFADAAARVIRREEADVMKKARELLGERSNFQAFLSWLKEFYKKHPDFVVRQMLPAVTGLTEAIQAELAEELNTAAGMTPELEKFASDYTGRLSRDHSIRSVKQLEKVIAEAHEVGEDEVEALQTRFDEWQENRPDKIAMYETVSVNGAASRFIMAAAGVTALVVRNTGNKTCPFCEQLDGRVVGIEQPILPAGSEITASDGSGMKIYGPKMNSPFHLGCVCVLQPERK